MKHKASCSCGQLTLAYDGEIKRISLCHCFECQKRTGSLFGVMTKVAKSKTVAKGESTIFHRKGDDNKDTISFHFCPKCGSTVYWESPWLGDNYAVAVGTFCDPKLPMPAKQVYGNRKHHWLTLPESVEEIFD